MVDSEALSWSAPTGAVDAPAARLPPGLGLPGPARPRADHRPPGAGGDGRGCRAAQRRRSHRTGSPTWTRDPRWLQGADGGSPTAWRTSPGRYRGDRPRHDEIRRTLDELNWRRQSVLSEEEARLVAEIDTLNAEISEYKIELEQIDGAPEGGDPGGRPQRGASTASAGRALKSSVRGKRQAAPNFADPELVIVLKWAGHRDPEALPRRRQPLSGAAPGVRRGRPEGDRVLRGAASGPRRRPAQYRRPDCLIGHLARGGLTDEYLRDYGIERPITDQQLFDGRLRLGGALSDPA